MEGLVSSQGKKLPVHTLYHKGGSHKDLWLVVREGSLADVDSSLQLLKKNGGQINLRNNFGLTPLHVAVWRNHIPIMKRLLVAGADPDARDGESGWSSLHRALHFGHLAAASILLQYGASITLEDSKFRTPVDLLSGPVIHVFGNKPNSVTTELYSWGSGTNYQLGTGNAHLQKLPCKVDSLHGSLIKLVAAAKFHSVAVTARGEVYTWGFGRGGRLGHPDFDIHSGQAAVITPRQVTSGLGSRRVKTIATAKHHTVVVTEGGEVFTWGSNREGQLGYTSVDTQPTPRKVSSLRSKIVAVSAANKHTAVVSESGEVFTWGCNKEGQLGYGTSNSASNNTPRVVEYLKGKVFTQVAASKFHTIVLGTDGEVFTWGHRLVTPRRVIIARNVKKNGTTQLKFHRKERLHVTAIAAGTVHSLALTDDGALFYWVSSDADLRCQQVYSLCGKRLVSLSAGKYWASVVTSTGDVYMWDAKKSEDKLPVVTRLHSLKRATSVSVGETHLLVVSSIYHPVYSPNGAILDQNINVKDDDLEELDDDVMFGNMESSSHSCSVQIADSTDRQIPSLKSLCEKVAAESLVEPRNAVQMLEIADSLGADGLKTYCEDIAIRNIDYIFSVSAHAIASASPDILATLEKVMDTRSTEPWSYRRLPTPTATLPAVISSEEEDSDGESMRTREKHSEDSIIKEKVDQISDSFLHPKDDPSQGVCKLIRALRKKLQQIEMLEEKQSGGHRLDDQQFAKLQTKPEIEASLAELGVAIEMTPAQAVSSSSCDGKGNKKVKQRRKSKQKTAPADSGTTHKADLEPESVKGFLTVEIPKASMSKEEAVGNEVDVMDHYTESQYFIKKTEITHSSKNKCSSPKTTKKKNKKGGLSMFLSGALDDTLKVASPPPPTPKSEGPAWGGAKISKGFASLREILDEQIKTKSNQPEKSKNHIKELSDDKSGGKILLSSYLPSNPIPVVSVCTALPVDGEKSSWAASGTPPFSRPSLRDIQMQQKGKQLPVSVSHSPKTRTSGFAVIGGVGSPSEGNEPNRWFKPEIDAPSSLRSIQIEEKAIKDLKRFYGSVKLVKNQSG